MNAELSKVKGLDEIRGWILYDGECPICRAWARRVEDMFTKRGFDFAPLQSPWVSECLGLDMATTFTEMRVVTRERKVFGGADAIVFLARRVWWAWPLVWCAKLPGAMSLLRHLYRSVAERRYCLNGAGNVLPHVHPTQSQVVP